MTNSLGDFLRTKADEVVLNKMIPVSKTSYFDSHKHLTVATKVGYDCENNSVYVVVHFLAEDY